jgi:hypothetical protein
MCKTNTKKLVQTTFNQWLVVVEDKNIVIYFSSIIHNNYKLLFICEKTLFLMESHVHLILHFDFSQKNGL